MPSLSQRVAATLAAVACAGATLAASVPGGSEARGACKRHCLASLRVADRPVSWRSPRVFRNTRIDDVAIAGARVNGRELRGAEIVSACRIDLYGEGVVVRAAACEKPRTRLHLRIVSANPRPVRVAVRYSGR
jgi:hypothetical protein